MGQQVQYEGFGKLTSPMSVMIDLRDLGVLNNKHIPVAYLRAPIEDRLLLLQGLMDTDGCADERGKCEYCGVNKALVEGVRELLLTLGVKAVVTEGRAMLDGRDCGPKYRITFTPTFQVFRIKRKADRLRFQQQERYRRRFIVAVRETPSVPVRCIKVAALSGQFLCGRGMIPTHNSDLILGLALTAHRRSLIIRQQYNDLDALTERALQINGTRQGFNGSNPPSLRTSDDRFIQFSGATLGQWAGHAFDLKAADEAAQMPEEVIRYHVGWLRSVIEGQRTRMVLASNPPVNSVGEWMIPMFRPWLDTTHPNPAKDGELRWFAKAPDGDDIEVDGPEPHLFPGQEKPIKPMSRTFIRARLADNPYLAHTDYESRLDQMDEPYRSAMRDGNFLGARKDQQYQVIPTEWVLAAQKRWTKTQPKDVPMTAIAADVGAGGGDKVVVAKRYGHWYATLIAVKGKEAPDGPSQASLVTYHRRDNCPIVVDTGGGYGGDFCTVMKGNGVTVTKFNGAEGSTARTKDGTNRPFDNKRAEAWWRFRELLNPDQPGGSDIALPDDMELRSDLTAPTYEPDTRVVKIESKVDIRKRLGRSPDRGDAVVMAGSPGDIAFKKQIARGGAGADRPTRSNVGFADLKTRQ
jgi:hypothetical protein